MPPKKKAAPKGPRGMGKPIPPGQKMMDLCKKEWQLGPVIGQGGFGYIYLGGVASGGAVTNTNGSFVIKVEPHANGPLFVELAFYQRVAKTDMISNWTKEKKKKHIGVPSYIATGSFEHNGDKFRFLVMDRFGTDIEKIYKENDYLFSEETVFSLGIRIIDALEYMHAKEYVHADIKSSNIMLGYTKAASLKAYLLDYGLAYRYMPGGKHVNYKEDPRRRHDGTVEYTSRDAHKGCAPSRRGDLEILGYCMLQWLCKKLPWEKNLNDKDYVMKEKIKYMGNIPSLMKECFSGSSAPVHLKDYLQYVVSLEYDTSPDYEKIRTLFKAGLKKAGHSDDGQSVILPSSGTGSTRKRRSVGETPSPKKRAKKNDDSILSPPASAKSKASTGAKRKTPIKRVVSSKKAADSKKSPSPRKAASPAKRGAKRTVDEPKAKTTNSRVVKVTTNGTSNGVTGKRVVHKRVRRKNVPTRDFGQSP